MNDDLKETIKINKDHLQEVIQENLQLKSQIKNFESDHINKLLDDGTKINISEAGSDDSIEIKLFSNR